MAGSTGRAAALKNMAGGRLWAVLVGDDTTVQRICCDRSNGGKEPIVSNAAPLTNGRFREFLNRVSFLAGL